MDGRPTLITRSHVPIRNQRSARALQPPCRPSAEPLPWGVVLVVAVVRHAVLLAALIGAFLQQRGV
eukprot:6677127-Prymnesium_polylepis.1